MDNRDDLFAVISAAGRDRRLSALTRALHGSEVPKSLAMIAGGGSLLQQTVASFERVVVHERVHVIVPTTHLELARTQLAAWPRVRIVCQPLDRGSGPAFLLGLAHVLHRANDPDVVLASADHYVPRPEPLVQALLAARQELDKFPVIIAGAAANRYESDRQWMLPGTRVGGRVSSLASVVEGPVPGDFGRLFAEGALWNTGFLVARGRQLWGALARELCEHAERIASITREMAAAPEAIAEALAAAPETDLMRALLTNRETTAIARVDHSGWSDWGSPQRVFTSLCSSFELAGLLSRLSRHESLPPSRPLLDDQASAKKTAHAA